MSVGCEDDEEDQAKNKDKHKHDQTQTSLNFSTAMTITLKPPKPFVYNYFDSMCSETSIVYTSKEKCIHNTITAQKELNTTECKVQNQCKEIVYNKVISH